MDLMVDIETFSTGSKAVMHELGAVIFDPYGEALGESPDATTTFHALIDPQSCLDLGMEVDWDTLRFWFAQDAVHHARLRLKGRKHVGTVLADFSAWIDERKPEYIWGHGATFDPVILNEYYKKLRKRNPFQDFRRIRDTRTLYDEVVDITVEQWTALTRKVIPHHPLYDAWAQARTVQFVKQQLRRNDGNTPGARGIPRADSSDSGVSGTHSQVPAAA